MVQSELLSVKTINSMVKFTETFIKGWKAGNPNIEDMDEWLDYNDYCINVYESGGIIKASVYPIVQYMHNGKTYKKEDMNNCLIPNLL
jgi:hypothetical protein